MKYNDLLSLLGSEPVFESSFLLAGDVDPANIRLQLSRWVNKKKIYQLRRRVYAVAPPYQKIRPHPFLIANHLFRASYVSLQTAMAYHGLIPEVVNVTVSVTTGRPERLTTPLGIFESRHIKPALLFGYQMLDLGGQQALVATPEKALLDLIYLQPGSASTAYLQELRLQNLENIDVDVLRKQAEIFDTPAIRKAVEEITWIKEENLEVYEEL
jgi:predicted transcriptional regulator of viral defense system